MPRLPNAERAVVEIAKLRDYCLNPEHEEGKHKARVFAAALGFTLENAEMLRDSLLTAASEDARFGKMTSHGQLYVIDAVLHGPAGEAAVRSAWILELGTD